MGMAEEAEAGGQGEGENVVIKWCPFLQDGGDVGEAWCCASE